jgi:MFS family permease
VQGPPGVYSWQPNRGVVSDAGSARRQQAIIALAGAARFSSGILMGTVMAVYVSRVGSEFAVSMVLTAYFTGTMLFAPIWGAVADVTGRRRAVMILTGGLATLAVIPLSLVESGWMPAALRPLVDPVWAPIALRGLYAVFAGGFVPVMLTVVSARGGETGRGRSIGFFNSARAVGFAGGQLAAGVLLGLLLPSGVYLVIAGISFVATVAAVFVHDPTEDPDRDPTVEELLGEVRRRLLPAVEDRAHLRSHGLRWLYVALALRNMTVLGVMSLMPPFLLGRIGVTEALMGVVLALNPASQSVFMYLFGRIADSAGRKPLIVLGMAGSGVFALVAAGAALPASGAVRVGVVILAFLLIGAAFSAMTTGAIAFIGDVAPADRESELMGLRSTAKGVGGVTGPPVFGAVATVATIQTAFAAGSILAFAATLLASGALVESRGDDRPAAVPAGDD